MGYSLPQNKRVARKQRGKSPSFFIYFLLILTFSLSYSTLANASAHSPVTGLLLGLLQQTQQHVIAPSPIIRTRKMLALLSLTPQQNKSSAYNFTAKQIYAAPVITQAPVPQGRPLSIDKHHESAMAPFITSSATSVPSNDLQASLPFLNFSEQNLLSRFTNLFSFQRLYNISRNLRVKTRISYHSGPLQSDRDISNPLSPFLPETPLQKRFPSGQSWDALIEYGDMELVNAKSQNSAFLLGIFQRVNQDTKIGFGIHYTDFSHQLSELEFTNRGLFFNIIFRF